MRAARWIILSIAIGLAACGAEEGERPAPSRGSTTKAASSNGSMTAEAVAETARGRVKCPAEIRSAPRDKSAPVDDIVGVRPGMTYGEAANLVMCTNELIVVAPDAAGRFRVLPAPHGGAITADIVEYELGDANKGFVLGRVRVGE